MSVIIRPGQLLRGIQARDPRGNSVPVQAVAPAPQNPGPPPIDAAKVLCDLMASVQESVQELEDRRKQNLVELQEAAVELAMAAASQVVGEAIDRDAFAVDRMVAEVLGRIAATGPVQVALHPADLKLLKAKRTEGDRKSGG
jgi:flagellar biosynthesis/type III secretory pathway protein FliH